MLLILSFFLFEVDGTNGGLFLRPGFSRSISLFLLFDFLILPFLLLIVLTFDLLICESVSEL